MSDEQQNFRLQQIKYRIASMFGWKSDENGTITRPRINSSTPVNVSIDGKKGEQVGRALDFHYS